MIPESELAFKYGDIVYHKTDGDTPGIVTAYLIRPNFVSYQVTWQTDRRVEFNLEIELTTERPRFSSNEPEDRLV